MTKDQVKAVLERVPTWPEDRQQELAAVDEGLAREAASEEEVKATFAALRRGVVDAKTCPRSRTAPANCHR
jgi:hypothetical protein